MVQKRKPPSDRPIRKTARENTRAREKFGRVAIRLGFVKEEQVKEALDIQRKMDESGQPHKLIGLIMLEQGMLSNAQLIEMLKYFELQQGKQGL
ncbi:MAG: hypothetical protein E3J72_13870 [Planctomycetota bacterium]|nr:MAG: hypothetical protein E3J72_13870 [Planctomycetota bacterium]